MGDSSRSMVRWGPQGAGGRERESAKLPRPRSLIMGRGMRKINRASLSKVKGPEAFCAEIIDPSGQGGVSSGEIFH